jgi:drug/metabolite transporter (DMT)-like permease
VFGLGGLGLSVARNRWAGWRAALAGGVMGGTAMFCGALLTLLALSAGVPGHVVYPAATGGSSILVVVLSVVLLKERPGRAGWLGIAVGLAALVLFSLATAEPGGG